MGLLSLGTPLPWEEAKKYVDHVRKNGIEQFINVWRQAKEAKSEPFVWGDELEYIIVRFNHQDRSTQISLNGAKSIQILQEEEIKAQVHAANG
ncbi:glutamate--cysteine ligase, partial [Spiromyces aspiralis]